MSEKQAREILKLLASIDRSLKTLASQAAGLRRDPAKDTADEIRKALSRDEGPKLYDSADAFLNRP